MMTSDRERVLTARLNVEAARSRKTTLRIVALTREQAETNCASLSPSEFNSLAEVLTAGEHIRARLKRRLAL